MQVYFDFISTLEFSTVSQYSFGLFSSHTRLDAEVGDF